MRLVTMHLPQWAMAESGSSKKDVFYGIVQALLEKGRLQVVEAAIAAVSFTPS